MYVASSMRVSLHKGWTKQHQNGLEVFLNKVFKTEIWLNYFLTRWTQSLDLEGKLNNKRKWEYYQCGEKKYEKIMLHSPHPFL
jgi:hypothetical protein